MTKSDAAMARAPARTTGTLSSSIVLMGPVAEKGEEHRRAEARHRNLPRLLLQNASSGRKNRQASPDSVRHIGIAPARDFRCHAVDRVPPDQRAEQTRDDKRAARRNGRRKRRYERVHAV